MSANERDVVFYIFNHNYFLVKLLLCILKETNRQEFCLVEKWLRKLCEDARNIHEAKIRNSLLYHLACQLKARRLRPPFTKPPPNKPFPQLMDLSFFGIQSNRQNPLSSNLNKRIFDVGVENRKYIAEEPRIRLSEVLSTRHNQQYPNFPNFATYFQFSNENYKQRDDIPPQCVYEHIRNDNFTQESEREVPFLSLTSSPRDVAEKGFPVSQSNDPIKKADILQLSIFDPLKLMIKIKDEFWHPFKTTSQFVCDGENYNNYRFLDVEKTASRNPTTCIVSSNSGNRNTHEPHKNFVRCKFPDPTQKMTKEKETTRTLYENRHLHFLSSSKDEKQIDDNVNYHYIEKLKSLIRDSGSNQHLPHSTKEKLFEDMFSLNTDLESIQQIDACTPSTKKAIAYSSIPLEESAKLLEGGGCPSSISTSQHDSSYETVTKRESAECEILLSSQSENSSEKEGVKEQGNHNSSMHSTVNECVSHESNVLSPNSSNQTIQLTGKLTQKLIVKNKTDFKRLADGAILGSPSNLDLSAESPNASILNIKNPKDNTLESVNKNSRAQNMNNQCISHDSSELISTETPITDSLLTGISTSQLSSQTKTVHKFTKRNLSNSQQLRCSEMKVPLSKDVETKSVQFESESKIAEPPNSNSTFTEGKSTSFHCIEAKDNLDAFSKESTIESQKAENEAERNTTCDAKSACQNSYDAPSGERQCENQRNEMSSSNNGEKGLFEERKNCHSEIKSYTPYMTQNDEVRLFLPDDFTPRRTKTVSKQIFPKMETKQGDKSRIKNKHKDMEYYHHTENSKIILPHSPGLQTTSIVTSKREDDVDSGLQNTNTKFKTTHETIQEHFIQNCCKQVTTDVGMLRQDKNAFPDNTQKNVQTNAFIFEHHEQDVLNIYGSFEPRRDKEVLSPHTLKQSNKFKSWCNVCNFQTESRTLADITKSSPACKVETNNVTQSFNIPENILYDNADRNSEFKEKLNPNNALHSFKNFGNVSFRTTHITKSIGPLRRIFIGDYFMLQRAYNHNIDTKPASAIDSYWWMIPPPTHFLNDRSTVVNREAEVRETGEGEERMHDLTPEREEKQKESKEGSPITTTTTTTTALPSETSEEKRDQSWQCCGGLNRDPASISLIPSSSSSASRSKAPPQGGRVAGPHAGGGDGTAPRRRCPYSPPPPYRGRARTSLQSSGGSSSWVGLKCPMSRFECAPCPCEKNAARRKSHCGWETPPPSGILATQERRRAYAERRERLVQEDRLWRIEEREWRRRLRRRQKARAEAAAHLPTGYAGVTGPSVSTTRLVHAGRRHRRALGDSGSPPHRSASCGEAGAVLSLRAPHRALRLVHACGSAPCFALCPVHAPPPSEYQCTRCRASRRSCPTRAVVSATGVCFAHKPVASSSLHRMCSA